MRIFIVSNKLCYGGAEKVGVLLANGLERKGHEVVIVADLYREQTYETDKNIKLLNLFPNINYKLVRWILAIFLLRKYFKRYKPNCIIGITESCSLISLIASLGLNIKIIETIHNSLERPKERPMSKKEFFMKFYMGRFYSCVTVLTSVDKKIIEGKIKNVHVMPNPLSLDPASEIPPKKKMILAAGRLEAYYTKGFDLLIRAWGEIAQDFPDWILLLAGYGTDEEVRKIQNIISKYGCQKQVELLGFQRNMLDLYKKSSIFVLSSRYEGFGLVLLEAMSQGCACIACDYKGRQKDIIEYDSQGILCEAENFVALENAIKFLIENRKERYQIQKNAIERSKAFTFDKIINSWNNLLNRI